MSRYRLPEPQCRHKEVQRVEAGDSREGPHAATYVCARPACVEDAMAWARAVTHQEPQIKPIGGTR